MNSMPMAYAGCQCLEADGNDSMKDFVDKFWKPNTTTSVAV